MSSTPLAEGYVQIVTKGLSNVQKDLDKLKANLDKATGATGQLDDKTDKAGKQAEKASLSFGQIHFALRKVEATAVRAFAVAAGAIAGFLKAAAPREMNELTASVGILAVRIGGIFLPLLKDVIKTINQVSDWFNHLTDAQKDQILHWTKIGLAVALGTVALVRLITIGRVAVVAFKGLSAAMGLIGAGPVGWILLAVGAVAALVAALANFGSVKEIFSAAWDAVQPLIEILKDLATDALASVGAAFEALKPLALAFFAELKAEIEFLKPVFKAVFEFGIGLIDALIKAFIALGITIKRSIQEMKELNPAEIAADVATGGLYGAGKKALGFGKSQEGPSLFDEIKEAFNQFDAKKASIKAGGSGDKVESPRDRPLPPIQKPEFIAFSDIFKRLNTVDNEDPKVKIAQEQLQQSIIGNKHLENIANQPVGART